ncbi:hypothetical protein [Candidatus Similichlamydia laticola]|uniref:Flagellar motor switch protein FliN-like C-terminal domain-containing protein n=1 Tax=Candidatus Similichlamydia laticola TaxID=2170265 RepID=A0A369KGJ3_9BACT|nr:hypothetical protein [Candidatus Similichlamydia laticola]RDB31825.1 hypothetical protein HAT2_00066 [Candidatus Similichlamydia laticola]
MSDWLEELSQKLLGANRTAGWTTLRDPEKEVLFANKIFSKAPFLSSYRLNFVSAQKSGLEGVGSNPCYARVELTGVADSAHLFIPYDHLTNLCVQSFGEAAAQDSDFLHAFLKFFLVEALLHLQKHPLLMGRAASLLECHAGVSLENFKVFKPASAVDLIWSTENNSAYLPMRLVFSPAFEKSWKENWARSEGAQREYLSRLKALPVTLHLQAAFAELSPKDVSQLAVGDWIVLEKVGFDSTHDWVTVMIFAEGIQIGVGTFDGKELTVRDLSPSATHQAIQGKRDAQNRKV